MLDRKYNQIKYSYYLFIKHKNKLDSFDHLLQITRKLGFRHCCTKTTLKSAHVLAFSAYKTPPEMFIMSVSVIKRLSGLSQVVA